MFEIHPQLTRMGQLVEGVRSPPATSKTNRSRLPSGFKSSAMILIRCTKTCRTKKLLVKCPAAPSLQTGKRLPGLCVPCPGLQGINSMMNPAALAAVLKGIPKARNLGSRSSVRICMFLGRIAYLEANRLGGCSEDKHNNLKYNGVPSLGKKAPSIRQLKGAKGMPCPLNWPRSGFV